MKFDIVNGLAMKLILKYVGEEISRKRFNIEVWIETVGRGEGLFSSR